MSPYEEPSSVEEYRPTTLESMVGQAASLAVLKGILERFRTRPEVPIPNLLLHGPPGCGKTTAAHAFARELLGSGYVTNFAEFNASADRGIKVVREVIIPYVHALPTSDSPRKVCFLDEADQLTDDAQNALRREMETNASTTVFLLAGNRVGQFVPAIRSRCINLYFGPYSEEEIRSVVISAAGRSSIRLTEEIMTSVLRRARGRPRDAIHLLLSGQSELDAWQRLEEESVRLWTPNGLAPAERIERFVEFLVTSRFPEDEMTEVLVTLVDVAREKKILPAERIARLYPAAGRIVWTLSPAFGVSSPLLLLRSFLYGEVVV